MLKLKRYTTIRQLGRGSFADVYKVKKDNGDLYALKKILIEERFLKIILGELDVINKQLIHDNIILVHESFLTEESLYIAMELSELGDLGNYFLKNKPKTSEKLDFMLDVARGVNYLHNQNIVHRDLKPENILLVSKNNRKICKITDFGISRIKVSRNDLFSTYIGSPAYLSPEVEAHESYSSPVDIFAVGLIFYAVYKSTVLKNSFGIEALIPGHYNDKGHITFLNETLRKTKPSLSSFLTSYFTSYETDVGSFIYPMLSPDPEGRPSAEDVLVTTTEIRATHKEREELKSMEKQKQEIQQEYDAMKRQLETKKQNNQDQPRQKDNQISQFKDENSLHSQVQKKEADLVNKETQNREFQSTNQVLLEKLKQKATQTESLKQKINRLEEQLSQAEMTQEKAGRISGVVTKSRFEFLSVPRLVLDVSAANPDIGDNVRSVLALPQGGALVGQNNTAIQLDNRGRTVRMLPVSDAFPMVTGFVLLDQQDVLILQWRGDITRVKLSNGIKLAQYKVKAEWMCAGVAVDNNNVLLVDESGKILNLNLMNKSTDVKLQGLLYPKAVVKVDENLYAICELNKVTLYNSRWETKATIGGQPGARDKLLYPTDIALMSYQTLLVSDSVIHRISAYSTKGKLIKHVIEEKDGLIYPRSLSVNQHNNHLWIVLNDPLKTMKGKLKVYQISVCESKVYQKQVCESKVYQKPVGENKSLMSKEMFIGVIFMLLSVLFYFFLTWK